MQQDLCYQNNPDSLFRKYAGLVTRFAQIQNREIALFLPNGQIEKRDDIYRMTVYPRAVNVKAFYPALRTIDALQYQLESFREAQEVLWWYLNGGVIPSIIKRNHFDVTTFNPDADPETTSVDGSVQRGSVDEAFSTIRGGAGNAAQDVAGIGTGAPRMTASTTNNQYSNMSRCFFLFDTSSLLNTIISAAVFSLYIDSNAAALGQSVGITSGTPASNTAIVNSDYAVANFGSTKFASDIAHGSITLSQYTDWALNANGLNAITKNGITKLAVRHSGDIDNSAPSWASSEDAFFTPYFSDAGSNKPKLTVTFTRTGAFLSLL